MVDLSRIPGRKIDKHSTGGVGDKTSLILAPIAAAAGVPVPMVSGRGLGHTGGTLDKLESIPGFRVDLDLTRYQEVLAACGLVMIGQTAEIAPADKFLYALRDATATVESIPLIAASIMSKKLAEGIDGLVLDVKTGDGAFMERLDDSRALAEAMCAIGAGLGKQMVALITRMDQPLGRAVGNAVEVAESLECLRGEGPDDLVSLVDRAGGRDGRAGRAGRLALRSAGHLSRSDRRRLGPRAISPAGGRAGGRSARRRRSGALAGPAAERRRRGSANRVRAALAARPVGHATMLLGAGRPRMDSPVDHAVGVILHKKVGDAVQIGEPLCTLLVNDESRLEEAAALILGAYTIAGEPAMAATPCHRAARGRTGPRVRVVPLVYKGSGGCNESIIDASWNCGDLGGGAAGD